MIADATRRQIGGLFVLADLGPQALAGFAEPQSMACVGEGDATEPLRGVRSDAVPSSGGTRK